MTITEDRQLHVEWNTARELANITILLHKQVWLFFMHHQACGIACLLFALWLLCAILAFDALHAMVHWWRNN